MPKRLVIDLDGTLTRGDAEYENVLPRIDVVEALRRYRALGFVIVVHTSRNMRTHASSLGLITAKTVPGIIDWLNRHDIPFDELVVGKPWCGDEGFYVDDRAVRPDEFANLEPAALRRLLERHSSPDR